MRKPQCYRYIFSVKKNPNEIFLKVITNTYLTYGKCLLKIRNSFFIKVTTCW